MTQDDRERSGHRVDHASVVDPHVGARIAQARRDAALTQRALADVVGVRLWEVDRWESGARAPSSEQLESVARATQRTSHWLQTGVGEHDSVPSTTNQADSEAGFGGAHQEVDERVRVPESRHAQAEVNVHEPALEFADAAEQTAAKPRPAELREAKQQASEAPFAETAELEAALEERERELQTAKTAQAGKQAAGLGAIEDDLSGLEEDARRHQELLAQIAEREDVLARVELEVQQALAQVDQLRAEMWRERAELAEIEEARREVDSARAEIVERERVLAEREAQVAALAVGLGGEVPDLRSVAQWLADSVKAAAVREAETVIKTARAQARQILEHGKAGREPPAEDVYGHEPIEEPDSQAR